MAETAMQRLSLSDAVREPNNNDVLCGRGGSINSHPGNEHFREMVEKYRKVYLNARFKQEKRLIATSIVSDIRALDPPGRFLAKDAGTGTWCDIGDEKARDKTSQALRENAPSIRAGIKGEKKPRPKTRRKPKAAAVASAPPAVHSAYPMQPQWGGYNGYYGHVPPPPPPGAGPLNPPPPPPQVVGSPQPMVGSHPGHYAPPQYQQPPAPVASNGQYQQPPGQQPPAPVASNMPWPAQPVAQNQSAPVHQVAQNQSVPVHPVAPNQCAPSQPVLSNDSSAVRSRSSHSGSTPHSRDAPDNVPSLPQVVAHQQGQNPHGGFTPPAALHTLGSAYTEAQQQNGGNSLQYSPIETNHKEARTNGQHARCSPNQPRESRNEESQVMEVEEESPKSSSLLNMVANHILGAWDTDAICGSDFTSERPKKLKGYHHSTSRDTMPPPKQRKKDDVAWSYNKWNSEPTGSNLSLGGSFDSQGISPAVSMEVDGTCPKEWRSMAAEMDNHSLGSLSSGLVSMNENVLNQVPSWEGSFMSTTSIKRNDSSSVVLPSGRRPDSTRSGSEISYAVGDYEDTRLAITLQQQENVAAYEEFKKRYVSTSKASTNRTARSSALEHIKVVRDKELDIGVASGNTNEFSGAEGYVPPNADSQEDADHKLAMELQKFEQARAGTVQQMEKLLREEREGNGETAQRTGRSVFWSKYT